METLLIPASLLAGGLLAVQAGANAQLSKATGSPFAATTLQLSVGTLALLVLALFTGTLTAVAALGGMRWAAWRALSTSFPRSCCFLALARSYRLACSLRARC
jgi:transporter family-2 protein